MNRTLIVAAAIAGALGVALSAAGAHMPNAERLATAGTMAMAQAPALLAIGLYVAGNRILTLAGAVIGLGLLLFSGALALHGLTGNAIFAPAAPIGGTLLILGWLGVAGAAFGRKS